MSAFFVSLAAIITGHIALGQIKRSEESGRGLAVAGLILGYAGAAAKIMILILAIVFAATIGAILVVVTASTSRAPPSSNSPSAPSADSLPDVPTGQLGAAHFDGGYLAVGTGATIVDVYLDPICPFCRQFETTNGDQLAGLVAGGDITLRLHSLMFLDWASQGTNYSSRASAALTCQATLNPAGTLDSLAALYANQPGENTVGLGDDELVALADGTDGTDGTSIANCVADGRVPTLVPAQYRECVEWSDPRRRDHLHRGHTDCTGKRRSLPGQSHRRANVRSLPRSKLSRCLWREC